MFCIPEIQFSNVEEKPPTTFSKSIQVGVGKRRSILSSATEMLYDVNETVNVLSSFPNM